MIYIVILLVILLPVVVFSFLFGFNVALARVEKRMVWPYGEPEAAPQVEDVTGYGAKNVADAVDQGFRFIGWSRDLKGPMYKTCYAMLVSPDRETLAIIGIGTMLGIRVAATRLQSTFADRRRWLSSIDHPTGGEPDASGRGKIHLVQGASFADLWHAHQERLRNDELDVLRLSERDPLRDYAVIRRERYEWMARIGILRFIGPAETHWRYTLRGAIKVALKLIEVQAK